MVSAIEDPVVESFSATAGVLEALASIASRAKVELDKTPALMRIENLKGYSYPLMRDTYKDLRNFTRVGNALRLETAYGEVPVEVFDTYENRFAAGVLSSLIGELSLLSSAYRVDKPLATHIRGNVDFNPGGSYEMLERLQSLAYKVSDDSRKIEAVQKLLSHALFLANLDFYKRLKGLNPCEALPTQLLLEDPDYSKVYGYAKKKSKENEKLAQAVFTKLESDLEKSLGLTSSAAEITYSDEALCYRYDKKTKRFAVVVQDRSDGRGYGLTVIDVGQAPYLKIDDGYESYLVSLIGVEDYSSILKALGFYLPYTEGICPLCGRRVTRNHCQGCGCHLIPFALDNRPSAWIVDVLALNFGGNDYE